MSSIIGDIFRGVGELIGGAADFVGDLVFGKSDSVDILIVAMLGSALAWYLGRNQLKLREGNGNLAAKINYIHEAKSKPDVNPMLKYQAVEHVLRKLNKADDASSGKNRAINKIKMAILNKMGIDAPNNMRLAVYNNLLRPRYQNSTSLAYDADFIKWLKDNKLHNMLNLIEDKNNPGTVWGDSIKATDKNYKKLYNAFYNDYKNIDPASIKPLTYNGRPYNIFSDIENAVLGSENIGFKKALNDVLDDSIGGHDSLFDYIQENQYSGKFNTVTDFADELAKSNNKVRRRKYNDLNNLYGAITDPSIKKSLEDIGIKPPKFSKTDVLNIISSPLNNKHARNIPNNIRRIGKAGTILSAIAKAVTLIFF